MIERKFTKQNVTEFNIKEYVISHLGRAGIGNVKFQLTPLGEKIIIFSSNPGIVVGKEGSNIKEMTNMLKKRFNLENPQIEISEVRNPNTNAQIVADRIAGLLERYGSKNFKGIMHKSISDVMNSGVRGVEIVLSGKLPGSRAKTWRILSGYMKKCGDIAVVGVEFAKTTAKLKSGVVGVKVKIMPSDITLPDTVKISEEEATEIIEEESEVTQESAGEGESVDKKSEQAIKKKDKKEKGKKEEKKANPKKSRSSAKKKEKKEKENVKESEGARGTEQGRTEE